MRDLNKLPKDLPKPVDNGETNHLVGVEIPKMGLWSTAGQEAFSEKLLKGKSVLFIFPRAGNSLEPNLNPELWDSIPGARGCTPQTCGTSRVFRKTAYSISFI